MRIPVFPYESYHWGLSLSFLLPKAPSCPCRHGGEVKHSARGKWASINVKGKFINVGWAPHTALTFTLTL